MYFPQLSKPKATVARNQNSICNRMEKKTLGETRLSQVASSPLARILLFIYCLLIVLIKIVYQIKSLLLSHHHSTSALVSEILMSVLQTVQINKTIYIWTVHIYRLYRRQCAKYTYIYSVHTVYYKDILSYQYTLYTVCIRLHYVHIYT